jgi:hypothetical protein
MGTIDHCSGNISSRELIRRIPPPPHLTRRLTLKRKRPSPLLLCVVCGWESCGCRWLLPMPAILIIIPCFLESYEDFDQPKKKGGAVPGRKTHVCFRPRGGMSRAWRPIATYRCVLGLGREKAYHLSDVHLAIRNWLKQWIPMLRCYHLRRPVTACRLVVPIFLLTEVEVAHVAVTLHCDAGRKRRYLDSTCCRWI